MQSRAQGGIFGASLAILVNTEYGFWSVGVFQWVCESEYAGFHSASHTDILGPDLVRSSGFQGFHSCIPPNQHGRLVKF